MNKFNEAKESRFSPRLLAGILLALFFAVALYLRVYLPYDQVFSGDGIKFTGADAYYHMRLVDNLVSHFPHLTPFDPYTSYPYGKIVGWHPFFDWLLAAIIMVTSWGSPTQHTIDVVGVYFPAILGALTVIPVYFIGKELFNRWAGVISAGLAAILTGGLSRSILGFTDHHVAETLFTTVTLLFLILAVKSAREKQLSFDHLRRRDWATSTKPLVYSMLASVFLGIYLLTWTGGLLFVFIIFAYFIIQLIVDHLRSVTTDYPVIVSTLVLLPASVIVLLLLPQTQLSRLYLPSLLIATLTPPILAGISRLMANKKVKPVYYPLTLMGLGLVGLAIFYVINPSLLSTILTRFAMLAPIKAHSTIVETQPLLFPQGSFSLSYAWLNFTTGFFLSLIALGILIYRIVKQGGADKTLFVVWSLVILAATLGQRRFVYYFVINVAVLTGYLSWGILELTGFKKLNGKPLAALKATKKKTETKKSRKASSHTTANYMIMTLGIVVVFFLVFFPNIEPAVATASREYFTPDDAWYSTLTWLKENTPEPFGDPNAYYLLYEPPLPKESYHYPPSAYGVMAWWDFGHWITRIGRRIPIATPLSWGSCSQFFSAEDEISANKIANKQGVRYVIIDYDTTINRIQAMATNIDASLEEFFDVYYQRQDSKLIPIRLFSPRYYHMLSARLYNFDGQAVTPEETKVISYQTKISKGGMPYKEITSMESFPSYEAAAAYVSSQKSDKYRIVSTSPFVSPVPLDKLEHYKLVYSSDKLIKEKGVGMIPQIKIFEYIK